MPRHEGYRFPRHHGGVFSCGVREDPLIFFDAQSGQKSRESAPENAPQQSAGELGLGQVETI